MKTQLTKTAITEYQNGSQEIKTTLKKIYGKKAFEKYLPKKPKPDKSKPIIQRIKGFNDILSEAGISKKQFEQQTKNLPKDETAYRKLKLISLVLNEGKKLTSNDYRYYPYFNVTNGRFVFDYTSYRYTIAYAGLGPLLCFATHELAHFAGTIFCGVYREFYGKY